MSPQPTNASGGESALRDIAARWAVREDRQLSTTEAAELKAWLAADPRHAAAFEDARASWDFFRALGSAVRRAPVAKPPRKWPIPVTLAAAAAVLIGFVALNPARVQRPTPPDSTAASSALIIRTLADGSVVQLKDGARIVEKFSVEERRVRLEAGEAFFSVRPETRPFLVDAGGVIVRAVGTAFAVRREQQAVDVVVTEGVVQVGSPAQPAALPAAPAQVPGGTVAVVTAGNRATVARPAEGRPAPVAVRAISREEIDRTLAWSGRMIELAGATLGELVAEFSRRSGRRIEVLDTTLQEVRIGGRFPIDDLDGFVRGLEEVYQVESARRDDGTIVLRLK